MLQIPPPKVDLTPYAEKIDYLAKAEFDPAAPKLVWSGNAASVEMGQLSEGGSGLYIAKDTSSLTYSIAVHYVGNNIYGTGNDGNGDSLHYYNSNGFGIFGANLAAIYKV